MQETEYLAALSDGRWPRAAQIVHQVIGRTLTADPISVNELHWGGYFVIDEKTRQVVGSCAYKAPPDEQGMVEIAYFTYPDFEGEGYATAMALKLIEMAEAAPEVRRIIAHTLPERNASSRLLEKIGMRFVGEVVDPEDGPVWQWEVVPDRGAMSETERSNLALVRDYLDALQRGEVGDSLARFFTPDAQQLEFPNRLNPNGQQSDLESILARSAQGRHLLSSQRYDVVSALSRGNRVAVEARWTGTLAIPVGSLPAGAEMKAHFAMFFELDGGRIARQHNYDCFEPW